MSSKGLALSGSDDFSHQSLERLSRPAQRQTSREVEKAVAQGIIANTHENLRAALTNTALQNVGALSSLEEHLTQVAPSGAGRYQHIVDAYALGAAQRIARW